MTALTLLIAFAGPFAFGFFTSSFVLSYASLDLQFGRRGKWRMAVSAVLGLISSFAVAGFVKLLVTFFPLVEHDANFPTYLLCMFSSSLLGVGLGGTWVTFPFLQSLARGWAFYMTFSDLYRRLGPRRVDVFVMRAAITAEPGVVERCNDWFGRRIGRVRSKAAEEARRRERLRRRLERAARRLGLTPEEFQRELKDAVAIYSEYIGERPNGHGG